jgi:hypothetical protein
LHSNAQQILLPTETLNRKATLCEKQQQKTKYPEDCTLQGKRLKSQHTSRGAGKSSLRRETTYLIHFPMPIHTKGLERRQQMGNQVSK